MAKVTLFLLLALALTAWAKDVEKPSIQETLTQPPLKIEGRIIGKNDKNHYETENNSEKGEPEEGPEGPVPCTCGIFLSGQFKKGSKDQPKGMPVLTQETDTPFMNNAMGNRQCTNKCLELIIKHLPKSNEIICAATDRDDIYKERAYLFIKNHSSKWFKTNMSAGREFCCKDYEPYKCPITK